MLARSSLCRVQLRQGFLGLRDSLQCMRTPSDRSFTTFTPICMGRRAAKIATRKGAQDRRKAKAYGKIGKLIIQAVKLGGADAVSNQKLKEVLQQARIADCPRDIIDRNIKKASDKSQADFTEVTYEAYGPGGTGYVLECLTDNLNRSAATVRSVVHKAGGKMADPGSVMFNFHRQGLVFVDPSADEDKVFEAAMEAGAEDVQPAPDGEDGKPTGYRILSAADHFTSVLRAVRELGLPVADDASGLIYSPLATVEIEDDHVFEQNESFMEKLMEVEDVDAVHTTCAGVHMHH